MPHDEQRWPRWATEPIHLLPADPAWADRANQDRDHLEVLLAPWLTGRIEHIGSTAIPNLAAKPIIDLQAPVAALDDPRPLASALAPHDWHYVPTDLDQRPWRHFFVKVTNAHRSTHLHVTTLNHPQWHEHIAFRDALRADPDLTDQYAALKQQLAAKHTNDREAYTAAKADFIRGVLDRQAR